jgi:hypothetical protein
MEDGKTSAQEPLSVGWSHAKKIRIGAKITKSERSQIKLQHVNGPRVNGLWTDKNV